MHCVLAGLKVSYVSNVELNLVRNLRHSNLEVMTHIILFLLVTGNTRISPMSVVKNLLRTAFPNEPVPPVIIKVLSLKRLISSLLYNKHSCNFLFLDFSNNTFYQPHHLLFIKDKVYAQTHQRSDSR